MPKLRTTRIEELIFLLVGFTIGCSTFFVIYHILLKEKVEVKFQRHAVNSSEAQADVSLSFYETQLADKLSNELRIFCWVLTHPDNHKLKVPHVMNTWGKRCNKLIFVSTQTEPDNPHIVALQHENGRDHLWTKSKLAMQYVYDNYINDYDWFLRADDDNYVVMENVRYMLSQYHPQTALYIGCRFAKLNDNVEEGYMAGGGIIYSKKALKKFIEISLKNPDCRDQQDSFQEDVYVGFCLKNLAIFLDGRDKFNQKRFFPIGTEEHMQKTPNPDWWYPHYLWRNVTQGGLGCCSDTFVEKHYATPQEMHLLDYLIYNVHPFGLQKNLSETLPRKLSIQELIELSDEKSFAKFYVDHERIHQVDEDERYKKK